MSGKKIKPSEPVTLPAVQEDWKPMIPDSARMVIYIISGVGTPLVGLIYQVLAIYGVVTMDIALQVSAVFATFFAAISGMFGIAHFTSSRKQ